MQSCRLVRLGVGREHRMFVPRQKTRLGFKVGLIWRLLMSRPTAVPPEDKARLVLAILAGELTTTEAARKAKVSEQSMSNWKRLFLESGRQGLTQGGKPGLNSRERQLASELEEVKAEPVRVCRSARWLTPPSWPEWSDGSGWLRARRVGCRRGLRRSGRGRTRRPSAWSPTRPARGSPIGHVG